METFFEKLEYRFLVESTTVESTLFPYRIVLSNVKTNRMGLKNGPITKNTVLPLTTLFFSKFNFRIRTSYN